MTDRFACSVVLTGRHALVEAFYLFIYLFIYLLNLHYTDLNIQIGDKLTIKTNKNLKKQQDLNS